MIFRTDIPKGSPIVIYRTGNKWPEILFLAEEPYEHYYDDGGEEIPIGMIQKWASLEEESPLPSNLDKAAEEYAYNNWEDNDYHTGARKGLPFDAIGHTEKCFKAGAEWMAGQFQRIEGRLLDWYETGGIDYCCGISTDEVLKVPEGFYIKKK